MCVFISAYRVTIVEAPIDNSAHKSTHHDTTETKSRIAELDWLWDTSNNSGELVCNKTICLVVNWVRRWWRLSSQVTLAGGGFLSSFLYCHLYSLMLERKVGAFKVFLLFCLLNTVSLAEDFFRFLSAMLPDMWSSVHFGRPPASMRLLNLHLLRL